MTTRILDLESREVALCRRRSVWCSWRLTVALAMLLAGMIALLWREL